MDQFTILDAKYSGHCINKVYGMKRMCDLRIYLDAADLVSKSWCQFFNNK